METALFLSKKRMENMAKTMQTIQILEAALITNKWESLDSLLNYVFSQTNASIDKEELRELIRLADIQLKNNVPLRDFV